MATAPPSPIFKKGNTAVITGGASGIGLALARKCAGHGMRVVICDNNAGNLKSAKESLGGDVEVVEMDVGRVEEFEKVKVSEVFVFVEGGLKRGGVGCEV
jgi:NAD(P)-dependent dehydrogenase (short-subunit alcohol dehydrogenase family)